MPKKSVTGTRSCANSRRLVDQALTASDPILSIRVVLLRIMKVLESCSKNLKLSSEQVHMMSGIHPTRDRPAHQTSYGVSAIKGTLTN